MLLSGHADPFRCTVHGTCQRCLRELRCVVLLAEVGSDHMPQARMIESGKQSRAGLIVEMAEATADALLERPGISAFIQHRGVVVAFEHQRVATAKHAGNVRRNATGVGEYAEGMRTIRKNELDRFARIVRHRKGVNLQFANGERLMCIDQAQVRQLPVSAWRSRQRAMRQEDFESMAVSAFENPGAVIAVFVCYQDCGKVVGNQAEARQARCQFVRTEAAIKQHFRATRLDDQRIAAAAAAE